MNSRLAAGAAGLVLVGAWATPATAAEVADLRISIDGATVSVDDTDRAARLTIFNAGPGDAREVLVTVDFGGLDATRVQFDTALCLEPNPTMCTFGIPDLRAGAKHTYQLTLINVGGTVGPAGSLAAFVNHVGTDPEPADNVTSIEVAVVDPGLDLSVVARDVYRWTMATLGEGTTPVAPGGESVAYALIHNEGTRTAKGVTVDVRVPAHVTISGPDPDPGAACRISADQRTATCDYPDVELIPGANASVEVAWPITVAADAPGPGALTGGTVTAAAIAEADPPSAAKAAAAAPGPRDIDTSDNTDRFSVLVAGPPPGGGGAGDPGLPVTGPMARGLAAAGAGLLILGGALVLLARRRRPVVRP